MMHKASKVRVMHLLVGSSDQSVKVQSNSHLRDIKVKRITLKKKLNLVNWNIVMMLSTKARKTK